MGGDGDEMDGDGGLYGWCDLRLATAKVGRRNTADPKQLEDDQDCFYWLKLHPFTLPALNCFAADEPRLQGRMNGSSDFGFATGKPIQWPTATC